MHISWELKQSYTNEASSIALNHLADPGERVATVELSTEADSCRPDHQLVCFLAEDFALALSFAAL